MKDEKLHAAASAIAASLGGWDYAAQQPYGHRAVITGPGGAILFVAADKHRFDPDGRLVVTGHYPHGLRGQWLGPSTRPRITVSAKRPPEAAAGDVLRRFVSQYLEAYGEAQRDSRKYEARQEKADAVARRLAAALGIETPDAGVRRLRLSYGDGPFGELEVSPEGDAVAVDVRGVPLETALRIAALLREEA